MEKDYLEKYGNTLREFLLNNENPRCGAKTFAKAMCKHVNYVYKIADVRGLADQEHYNHFPLEYLVAFTMMSGDWRLLDFIEKECGRVAVVVPTIYNDTANVKLAARILKESAEAADEWLKACDDGTITTSEKQKVFKEVDEAIKALAALWMRCR